jgi:hypothetical protein
MTPNQKHKDSVHDQAVQDAEKIVKTVSDMIEKKKTTDEIERAVVRILSEHAANQLAILLQQHVAVDYD